MKKGGKGRREDGRKGGREGSEAYDTGSLPSN
jgi:hypothetical protein